MTLDKPILKGKTVTFQAIESKCLVTRRLCDDDVDTLASYRNLPQVARMQLWESYSAEEACGLVNSCKVVEPFIAGN